MSVFTNLQRCRIRRRAEAANLPLVGRGIAYGDFGVEFRLRKDSLERQLSEGATAISCLESYFGAVPDPRAPNAT
ncbi:hypothetical protein NKH10_03390, partial [Mesorhizobium sp. M1340]|uniref:hypothetical protein n=1 Tax=Mesorhizobium sp. M1340 TaxID=2957087 RepID=UPI00333DD8CA